MDIRKPYREKGFGLVFAIAITFIYFVYIPKIIKNYIWPLEIENPKIFYFLFSILVHEGIFIICNITSMIIYKLELDFFERYKVHDQPWPWKENREEWTQLLKKTIKTLFINQFILIPLILYIKIFIFNKVEMRMDYNSLPSAIEIIWQVGVFIIFEDFWFYWSHRFLHWEVIYPYIHKIHHEHKITVSLASEHAHPFEFIIGNLFPSNFGILVLNNRAHILTYGMWIIIRIIKTTDAHMGYQFSWSPIRLLPFQMSSDFHSYHHLKFKGNYASFFRFWDTLFGTINPSYSKLKEENKFD